jgi:hypothetical protein
VWGELIVDNPYLSMLKSDGGWNILTHYLEDIRESVSSIHPGVFKQRCAAVQSNDIAHYLLLKQRLGSIHNIPI